MIRLEEFDLVDDFSKCYAHHKVLFLRYIVLFHLLKFFTITKVEGDDFGWKIIYFRRYH